MQQAPQRRMQEATILAAAVLTALGAAAVTAQDEKVLAEKGLIDAPGGKIRTNQYGLDFKAPATKEAWLKRREEVRRRILVSTGLYPLPKRTPLNPQIYGKIERAG